MAAIVRVKRRRNEDPAESLVFLCKKFKKDDETSNEGAEQDEKITSLFKFAGTTTTREKVATQTVRQAIRKDKLEKEYKQHNADISSFTAQQHKSSVSNARYKITSHKRALDFNDLARVEAEDVPIASSELPSGGLPSRLFCLYDVEKVNVSAKKDLPTAKAEDVITCNGVPMVRERLAPPGEDKYVYDLYYMNNANFDFRALENILTIEAYREEIIYLPEEETAEEVYEDEDNENDESNWRNDYPEEDPCFYEYQNEQYMYAEDGTIGKPLTNFNDDEDDDDFDYGDNDDDDEYSLREIEDKFRRQIKFENSKKPECDKEETKVEHAMSDEMKTFNEMHAAYKASLKHD